MEKSAHCSWLAGMWNHPPSVLKATAIPQEIKEIYCLSSNFTSVYIPNVPAILLYYPAISLPIPVVVWRSPERAKWPLKITLLSSMWAWTWAHLVAVLLGSVWSNCSSQGSCVSGCSDSGKCQERYWSLCQLASISEGDMHTFPCGTRWESSNLDLWLNF